MKNYYKLDNKKIFLWGNTSFTSVIYDNLSAAGIEVSGIIEKNNTTIKELKIYKLSEIVECDYVQEEVVFILCLNSSLNQEKLAREIYDQGYHNVILAPLTLKNTNVSYHMRTNYEHLLYGDVNNLLFPIYDILIEDSYNYRVVKYMGKNVVVNVNINYIRTFYRDNVEEDLLCFRDKPIAEYDYLHELYDYFYNDGFYPKNYMRVYMHGEKDKQFIEDRKQLFEIFKNGYQTLGMSFFESIPIPVELKENGLNIMDGMHRASFIFKYGISVFPVIMSGDDFELFVSRISKEEFE